MVSNINKSIIITSTLIGAILIASFSIIYSGPGANLIDKPDMLYQVSAFNTFSLGNFEGNTTFAELEKHGDFGIGTINGLNGEMIALNGVFYQIPTSGIPRQINPSEKTPYATVSFFHPTQTIQLSNNENYSQITSKINSTLSDYNAIYAIKIHGFFDSAKTRSVPIQTLPYPTIAEAVKNQTVFTLNNVEGTAIGFYFPNNMDGVDSIGYHLHFITDNHSAGGHLLDCNIKNATVEIDQINNYYLKIP